MAELRWDRVDAELYRAVHPLGTFEIVKTGGRGSMWRVHGPDGYTSTARLLEEAKVDVEGGLKHIAFLRRKREYLRFVLSKWEDLGPHLSKLTHPNKRRADAGETLWDYYRWKMAQPRYDQIEVVEHALSHLSQAAVDVLLSEWGLDSPIIRRLPAGSVDPLASTAGHHPVAGVTGPSQLPDLVAEAAGAEERPGPGD